MIVPLIVPVEDLTQEGIGAQHEHLTVSQVQHIHQAKDQR